MNNQIPINFQMPFPSFEDIRKILQFWIDQQDKWFYFEIGTIQSGTMSLSEVPNTMRMSTAVTWARTDETNIFLQGRIIGKISDVISYPPSLFLQDTTIFTVSMQYDRTNITNRLVSSEKRNKYGLVFSQITYYEPINDITYFVKDDTRVNLDRL